MPHLSLSRPTPTYGYCFVEPHAPQERPLNLFMPRCSRSVLSVNTPPATWRGFLVIVLNRCTLCSFHLCAWINVILVMVQPAGAAPFPWHNPCIFLPSVDPSYTFESPKPVLRENFMSCMMESINTTASWSWGTPRAWKTNNAIRCVMWL